MSCVEAIKLSNINLELIKVPSDSISSKVISTVIRETPAVKILFEDGYDDWFNGLSKSVRQNIRTAYNRLNADGKSFDFQFISGQEYLKHRSEIMNLYIARHNERYGLKTSWLKKWYLNHQSFATKFYSNASNAITAKLSIDGKCAGFFSGVFKDNRLIIPRLSINNEFKRYSPGMLLINEAIKEFSKRGDISILDLSVGEESYKYQLGGIKYYLLSGQV